jgi:hypothetical protein
VYQSPFPKRGWLNPRSGHTPKIPGPFNCSRQSREVLTPPRVRRLPRMRDIETIDSELRLVAALRRRVLRSLQFVILRGNAGAG